MTKNVIAIILLVIGVLGMMVLLTYGGPVLPHIVGPAAVALIGLGLLLYKKKA